MLRIKNSCVLQELEKFGFKKTIEDDEHIDGYEYVSETELKYEYLIVAKLDRKIVGNAFDLLYDLIKAGFVEKIEEKR